MARITLREASILATASQHSRHSRHEYGENVPQHYTLPAWVGLGQNVHNFIRLILAAANGTNGRNTTESGENSFRYWRECILKLARIIARIRIIRPYVGSLESCYTRLGRYHIQGARAARKCNGQRFVASWHRAVRTLASHRRRRPHE